MASARARMGALRRKIGKRQKTAGVASGIFSTLGTVAAFGAGQAKKAETAWGEYEAGYEALDGEGFERPKFGQKGYFKGPEGEVQIGDMMYDRSKIQEAGSFLGSDAASVLSDDARSQYLKRTAPGREAFVPRAPSSPPDYAKIQAGVAQYEKTAADRLKMETELAGWEAHDVARGQLDIDIRRDEQDKILENYRSKTYELTTPKPPQLSENVLMAPRLARQRADQAAFDIGAGQFPPVSENYQNPNQFTDEQRQPYMKSPKRNAWDSQIENNKNRRPYDLRPPEIY